MIKRIFLGILLACLFAGCSADGNSRQSSAPSADGVTVYYFYNAKRCPTCLAIEQETANLLQSAFADEIAAGRLHWQAVDLGDAGNAELAARYEVAWSSLIIVTDSTRTDLTQEAFTHARNHPDLFRDTLAQTLRKLLK